MGRASTKDNNKYQFVREGLGISRERASELLEVIPPERIKRLKTRDVPRIQTKCL